MICRYLAFFDRITGLTGFFYPSLTLWALLGLNVKDSFKKFFINPV